MSRIEHTVRNWTAGRLVSPFRMVLPFLQVEKVKENATEVEQTSCCHRVLYQELVGTCLPGSLCNCPSNVPIRISHLFDPAILVPDKEHSRRTRLRPVIELDDRVRATQRGDFPRLSVHVSAETMGELIISLEMLKWAFSRCRLFRPR